MPKFHRRFLCGGFNAIGLCTLHFFNPIKKRRKPRFKLQPALLAAHHLTDFSNQSIITWAIS